ncbi:hypothetical protein [Crateriforma spongiae]|uniref:hypothetical protein n=1 Tax=Crateriforma spongiae TaxID=2724528 RepID=UPI00144825EF|nr:hypothetical protein [Crateriforma spongiae]
MKNRVLLCTFIALLLTTHSYGQEAISTEGELASRNLFSAFDSIRSSIRRMRQRGEGSFPREGQIANSLVSSNAIQDFVLELTDGYEVSSEDRWELSVSVASFFSYTSFDENIRTYVSQIANEEDIEPETSALKVELFISKLSSVSTQSPELFLVRNNKFDTAKLSQEIRNSAKDAFASFNRYCLVRFTSKPQGALIESKPDGVFSWASFSQLPKRTNNAARWFRHGTYIMRFSLPIGATSPSRDSVTRKIVVSGSSMTIPVEF